MHEHIPDQREVKVQVVHITLDRQVCYCIVLPDMLMYRRCGFPDT